MASRELKVEIIGDSKSLQKALGSATDHTSKFGGALRTMGKAAALGIGAVAVGFGVVLKKGFDELAEGQKVMAQTTAALKSTGGAANVTAKDVEALATAQSKLTGIDDEAVQAGENMLLTFTKVRNEVGKGNDIFNQATVAIEDMATRMKNGAIPSAEELSQTAIRVGKSLNDPIKGMTALSRVGVQFDESQRAAIKTMVAAGDTMGAQKLILAELTKEFGGSAKAAGETLPGQLSKLRNSFEEVAGKVAERLLPALTSMIDAINDHMPEIERVVTTVMDAVGSAITTGIDAIRRNFDAIKTIGTTAFQGLIGAAKTLINFFKTDFGQTIALGVGSLLAMKTALGAVGLSAGNLGTALTALKGNPLWALLIPISFAIGSVTKEFIDQKLRAQELADALDSVADATNRVKSAQGDAKQASIDLGRARLAEKSTNEALAKAIAEANAAEHKYGAESAQAKAAHDRLTAAKLDETQADLDLANAKKRNREAQGALTDSYTEGTDKVFKMTKEIRGLNLEFGQEKIAATYSQRLHEFAIESAVASDKMGGLETAAGRARVKTAIMAQAASDLAKELGRVPSRSEIIARARLEGGPQFKSNIQSMVVEGIAAGKYAAARASEIGSAFASAAASGAYAYASVVNAAFAGVIATAINFAKQNAGSTVEEAGEEKIGKPLMRSVASGAQKEAAKTAQDIADALRDAISKAQGVVSDARSGFASAFSDLATTALDAFDAAMSSWKPPAQILLDKRALREETQSLKDAIASAKDDLKQANKDLNQAILGGDPEAIATAKAQRISALKSLHDAEYAQWQFQKERLAAQQQEQHDERAAKQRIAFEKEAEQIQARVTRALNSEKLTQAQKLKIVQQGNEDIQDSLRKHGQKLGVDADFWGSAIGIGMANGMQKAISAVTKAANMLAKAVAKLLKLRSPAEEGPMADLDVWWDDLGPMLAASALKGAGVVSAAGTTLAGSLLGKTDVKMVGKGFETIGLAVGEGLGTAVDALDGFNKTKDATRDNIEALGTEAPKSVKDVSGSFGKEMPKAADSMEPFIDKLKEAIASLRSYVAWAREAAAASSLVGPGLGGGGMGGGGGGGGIGGTGPDLPPWQPSAPTGGNGYNVTVNVEGSVTSEGDLVDAIHRGLAMKSKSGYGALFSRTPGVVL